MVLVFCSKCGDKVDHNEIYCNKCGNYLGNNVENQNNQTNNSYPSFSNNLKTNNKKMIFIGLSVGVGVLLIVFVFTFLMNISKEKFSFSNNNYENSEQILQNTNNSNNQKKGKYSTIINTDNTYSGVKIKENQDAYELIVKDSVTQKNNCPIEIQKIENDIINKYGVTAVNLCEMDIKFAEEILNVFEKIYIEYPSARGNLTNLSLKNASLSEGYIAAFQAIFPFATSDSVSTYPWIIKTQVLLNTTYFLNQERLEASVSDGSSSGHFLTNATVYSPIAHELGHYLSFLALMKSYEFDSILLIDDNSIETFYDIYDNFANGDFSLLMIKEAYENYKKDIGTSLTIDEWRNQISDYAVAKDNNGEYIYDETIAEAFHDVYLNDKNAKDVSIYIVNVLKEKLGEI